MYRFDYKEFKMALKRYEEKKFEELKAEIKKMKESIEKMLTLCFESSASQARTNYSGLDMC